MDKKKEDDAFLRMKIGENQSYIPIMISVDGKGTAFLVKLKLEGELRQIITLI